MVENKKEIEIKESSSENMTRRAFIKLLMGFSVVVSTIPLMPVMKFFFAPPIKENQKGKKITNVKDLPEGNTMVFFYPGDDSSDRSFLTHLSKEYQDEAARTNSNPYINNGFVAYNTVCPHLQCPIELPDDDVFICPCHGAFFSVVDGTVLGGPSPRALPIIKLEIDESSGDIYATELIGKIGYGRE